MKYIRSRRRGVAALTAFVAGALITSGCAGNSEPDPGVDEALTDIDPIELTVTAPFSATTTPSLGLEVWMEEVTANTDGKVTFDVYHDSTLHAGPEALTALESGLADIVFYANSWFPQELPVGNWNDLLVVTQANIGLPHTVLAAVPIAASLNDTESALRDELASRNAIPLLPNASAPYFFLCTSPVETLEQAGGKQIRVGGQPWTDEVTEAGFTPVFLPPAEMYESLQRGVIDCVSTNPTSAVADGLLGAAKYISLSEGGIGTGSGFAFAKDAWEELPESVRDVMTAAQSAYITEFAKETLEGWTELFAEAEAEGVTFVETAEFDELWNEYRMAALPEIEASAPAGIDGSEHVQNVRSRFADWNTWIEAELGVSSSEATDDLESRIASYETASEGIDWDVYEAKVREYLSTAFD